MFFANSSASNVYRWVGDGLHIFAIVILLVKFYVRKNSTGLSGKTQLLFALTYTARYLDVWTMWVSYYNTVMKIFYIFISYSIVYLTLHVFKETYNKDHDSFRIEVLLIPVTLLAFTINYQNTFMEISWAWSIYLESVSLVPQLYMIWKAKTSDCYVILYVLFMGLYRGLYIANWAYRYKMDGHIDLISITGGIIETFIGLVGFLCVISQSMTNAMSSSTKVIGRSESVYVIPLISNECNSKVDADVVGKTNAHHLSV